MCSPFVRGATRSTREAPREKRPDKSDAGKHEGAEAPRGVAGRRIEPAHPAPQERHCETDPYNNVERCGVDQGFGGGKRHGGATFWPFDAPTQSALLKV